MSLAVDGVVLCHAGQGRLAVDCAEIDAIAASDASGWNLTSLFGDQPSSPAKALQCSGQLLNVDSVDVVAAPGLPVLPVPHALAQTTGGALRGFVQLAGTLWPLVAVGPLLDHLDLRSPR